MKGVIVNCLAELVQERFGKEQWVNIQQNAGLDPNRKILVLEDFADEQVMKLIQSTCTVLNVSLNQAADAFGDYWVCHFAPKIYHAYYQNVKNAKDFLLKMDSVHEFATKNIENAHPPRFNYNWPDERTLIMTYKSKRKMIDIMVGLVKGVGKYFNEPLNVSKQAQNQIKIIFEK